MYTATSLEDIATMLDRLADRVDDTPQLTRKEKERAFGLKFAYHDSAATLRTTTLVPDPVRQLTCGCCNKGCVCSNHMDIPNGRPVHRCAFHKPSGASRVVGVLQYRPPQGEDAELSAGKAGILQNKLEEWCEQQVGGNATVAVVVVPCSCPDAVHISDRCQQHGDKA